MSAKRRFHELALFGCLACAPSLAQSAEPDPLDRLLKELTRLDKKIWEARFGALEAKVQGETQTAAGLRQEAAALLERAAAAEARSKVLAADLKRHRDLFELVQHLAVREKPKEPAQSPDAKGTNNAAAPAPPAAAPAPAPMVPKPASEKKATTPAMKPPGTESKKGGPRAPNFEDDVQPLFQENCAGCHNPGDASGGLDLTSFDAVLRGGSGGPVVQAGAAESSRLYRLPAHLDQPHMPPRQEKLPDAKLEIIRQWITAGAHSDAVTAKARATEKATAKKKPAPRVSTTRTFEGPPPMPEGLESLVLRPRSRPPVPKALAASPRAPVLAIPGSSQIVLHHSETLQVLGVLAYPFPDLEVLRFSADGTLLLAAGGIPGRRGQALLYDVRTGKVRGEYGREFDTALAAAVSPGLSLVAVGGASKKVRVYATATGEQLYEINGHNDWVLALDVSPDGNYIASGDRSGQIVVTEADTGRNVHVLSGHRGAVHALRFRPDAGVLVSAGEDGSVRTWDLARGRELRQVRAHQGEALALDWRADNMLVTTGSDGRARLFAPDGKPAGDFPPLQEWIYSACFEASGKLLFTGTWNGRVHLFDVARRQELPGFVSQ